MWMGPGHVEKQASRHLRFGRRSWHVVLVGRFYHRASNPPRQTGTAGMARPPDPDWTRQGLTLALTLPASS